MFYFLLWTSRSEAVVTWHTGLLFALADNKQTEASFCHNQLHYVATTKNDKDEDKDRAIVSRIFFRHFSFFFGWTFPIHLHLSYNIKQFLRYLCIVVQICGISLFETVRWKKGQWWASPKDTIVSLSLEMKSSTNLPFLGLGGKMSYHKHQLSN